MAETIKAWIVKGADGQELGRVRRVGGTLKGPKAFVLSLLFLNGSWSNGYISTIPEDRSSD
jgi:hypothetical protein